MPQLQAELLEMGPSPWNGLVKRTAPVVLAAAFLTVSCVRTAAEDSPKWTNPTENVEPSTPVEKPKKPSAAKPTDFGGIACRGKFVTITIEKEDYAGGEYSPLKAMERTLRQPFAHILPEERALSFWGDVEDKLNKGDVSHTKGRKFISPSKCNLPKAAKTKQASKSKKPWPKIAGCPKGLAGPPSPGTVCPDGTIPNKDPSLSAGCPGSTIQTVLAANYKAVCPPRPGRSECTARSDWKCIRGGYDVSRGDYLRRRIKKP